MFQKSVCFAFSLVLTAGLVAAPSTHAQDETVNVLMKTSEGDILIELNKTKAPLSVENFVKYVEDGFYQDTVFHRVIPDFMIQGGGMTADLKKKTTRQPIRNEAGNELSNAQYTIAMARTGDPHSATSQFFINVVDNKSLDRAMARDGYGYTVFGKVIDGQETVDKIRRVKTVSAPNPEFPAMLMQDVPAEPVTILGAEVVEMSELP